MKRVVLALGLALAVAVLYLLLWPVPVDPVSWQAPVDRGMVDPFGPDDRLRHATGIDLGEHDGPEDVTAGQDGRLYATTKSGKLLQVDGYGNVREFADVGGRALGIEMDADGSFVVANAYVGLQRVTADGSVEILLDEVDGRQLMYADDLAIADNGVIYFSEASTKFGAMASSGTYEGSLLDIMEHGGHGQVIAFDPASGSVEVIIDGLQFANGVAISDDQSFLLVAETGSYRILKHWLTGPDAGRTEVLMDNLPGFPDNINNGFNDRFWVGLVAPRVDILDTLSDKPFLRKVVQRLPASVRPKAEPYSHVFAIDGDGEVLINLRDPAARFPSLTGVYETRNSLYLTRLFGNELPVLNKENL
jgi:sugar lactone lactonase YvrE